MLKRLVGQTNITVSVAGLGTTKFGRNQKVKYPQHFELPTDSEILTLLDVAQELGINLIDTAPAYGHSEMRLGNLLAGKRDQWVLSTKVGEEFEAGESHYDFSATKILSSIERSLQRLKTDYLDIVLVHSNGDDEKIIAQDQVFSILEKCKQTGKIRAYGMSTKTVDGGIQTLRQADVAMVTYHPQHMLERPVIEYAHKHQKGIFIKKAFASGHLLTRKESLQFILREPGVTSIILGTINPQHLRENVAAMDSVLP